MATAVASGARQLLAHVEVSVVRAEEERGRAEAAKAERERELAAERGRGRDLKSELDRLTDSVHRGEVLGAEKRLRMEQVEAKALEEFGVEPRPGRGVRPRAAGAAVARGGGRGASGGPGGSA